MAEDIHFTERASVAELVEYFGENDYPCTSATFNGPGQVGRLNFACGAVVSLYAKGTALVQGRATMQHSMLRELLRVAKWDVKK